MGIRSHHVSVSFVCLLLCLLIVCLSTRFQNIVPISLYISVEGVRTCQALFIYFDKEMWYEKTDQATLARSWNLSDDLGQIEYIFSDKTGTLTQVCSHVSREVNGIDRASTCAELYDIQTMFYWWKSL
jgi:P-type E1-E2 ATPase